MQSIGRGAGWYSILNKLSDNAPEEWNITQLEPEKSPKQIANDLTAHFSSITNQTTETEVERIRSRKTETPLIPQLLDSTVEKKIKEYKKTY